MDEDEEFSSDEDEAHDELDPIAAERRRRSKAQDRLISLRNVLSQ
jgi:hypothetical protein